MSKNKQQSIHNALPIVAAAYGEKFGVNINIGGNTAFTDGQSINVPAIPADYENMDALWGYLAHECAHVRFTDFTVSRYPGLHAQLSNALEDCRIELEMIKLYPGTRSTLNETAKYMAQAGHYSHVDKTDHPGQIIMAYCLYWLQSLAVGQKVLLPYLETAKKAIQEAFPSGVYVRLSAILRKVPNATSTAEIITLTEEIIAMLEDEKEKQEQKQDQGDSQGSGSQGEGQDSDEGDSQSSGSQGESQDDGQGSSNSDGPGQQGGNKGRGSGSRESGDKKPDDSMDTVQSLTQALEAGDNEFEENAQASFLRDLQASANQAGQTGCQAIRIAKPSHDSGYGSELTKGVRGTTSKIRSQLYGLVQASQRTSTRNNRTGKRLDRSKLHRVLSGDTRIFRTPAERKAPNAAVHILVDMSGSMNHAIEQYGKLHYFADIARDASLSIAMALEPIKGVNPAVTYFCYHTDYEPPVISVVGHGESVVRNAGKFFFSAKGSTPMAEAMWYAAYELTKTKEQRKMMVVITDGAPDDHIRAQEIIELCKKSNVELIGVGICTNSVANLFDNHIVINDISDLRTTLFQLMSESLSAN